MTSPIGYVPKVGDHVFVGPVTDRKVHWVIVSLLSPTIVMLESPMSGRRQHAPVRSLTLHPGPALPDELDPAPEPTPKRRPGRPKKETA